LAETGVDICEVIECLNTNIAENKLIFLNFVGVSLVLIKEEVIEK
jgi:hypothetical protein